MENTITLYDYLRNVRSRGGNGYEVPSTGRYGVKH
ncbi:hypothetical protein J2X61_001498 [Bacillus sp. 3255]|nr:hypothetical protein [Bacillus sp. 3255]